MPQFPLERNIDFNDFFIMTPYEFRISANRRNRRSLKANARRILNTNNQIVLPTPTSGLTLNENGNWEDEEGYLSFGGGATAGIAKKVIADVGSTAKQFTKGQFINDYASLSYKGSNFRTFSFSWNLIPSSQKEAIEINNIIKILRRSSLPNYKTNDLINASGSAYPNMWVVAPVAADGIDFLIQDSTITNLSINYSPDGELKLTKSDHSMSVNIEIEFKELYRADRRDVGE